LSKPSSGKTKDKEGASATRSKEIKIITKQVVTLDDIAKDPVKIKLLYIVSVFGEISDKALQYLIYELGKKGYELGYSFTLIGNTPSSRELSNDLIALKYTGLLETNIFKKNIVSSLGKEFLDKHINILSEQERDTIKKLVDELRTKIKPIDLEVELKYKTRKTKRLFF